MNFQLDTNVWFGDWNSPLELKYTTKTIINVAHHFSTRKLRNVYWKNLEQLPWDIFYVRLAKKDHDTVNIEYLQAFEQIVLQAVNLNKLPILCHCQIGAHRGPTSGIAAAWILNGKTLESLNKFITKATELRPKYANSIHTPYRKSMTQLMQYHSH